MRGLVVNQELDNRKKKMNARKQVDKVQKYTRREHGCMRKRGCRIGADPEMQKT